MRLSEGLYLTLRESIPDCDRLGEALIRLDFGEHLNRAVQAEDYAVAA
jgi:hypothetical protein